MKLKYAFQINCIDQACCVKTVDSHIGILHKSKLDVLCQSFRHKGFFDRFREVVIQNYFYSPFDVSYFVEKTGSFKSFLKVINLKRA